MAKTTAPLLSFGAAGQLGKTMVAASWRGVSYMRRYVIPANPRSEQQTETRGAFSWLQGVWKQLNPAVQEVWLTFAKGRPLTDRNAWTKANLAALRGTTAVPVDTLDGVITSPGANAGLAADSITTADDEAHGLTVTLVAPDLPADWTITFAHFVVFKQADAKTSIDYTSHYMSDAADPYTVTFATIGAGSYVATGFFQYVKPDGTIAFSPSVSAVQVVA